jgi:hypothetical protein
MGKCHSGSLKVSIYSEFRPAHFRPVFEDAHCANIIASA